METELKNNLIKSMIYIYIVLPIFLFIVGWLKLVWAIVFGAAVLFGLFMAVRSDAFDYTLPENEGESNKFGKGLIIIFLWVLISGIGAMAYQNSDFNCRSAMFRALVEYDWPVISADGTRGLTYYIGFWLPSAAVGKILGYRAGTLFQLVWAFAGISIVFYLMCVWRKKVAIWPLVVMIFFSGLDYIATWVLGKPGTGIFAIEHLEQWAGKIQYSSMTTQLFWVFNQAVPAWVVIMLIYVNSKNKKNMLFLMGCILFCSTFPFVGLLPFVVYFLLKDFKISKKGFLDIFSIQNIIGVVIIGGISFVYLIGNIAAAGFGILSGRQISILAIGVVALCAIVGLMYKCKDAIMHELSKQNVFLGLVVVAFTLFYAYGVRSISDVNVAITYIFFYLIEFMVYAYFVYEQEKNNPLFYIMFFMLMMCPFIIVGTSADFCMRASIPSLFILMLFCIKTLERLYTEKKKVLLGIFAFILVLGAMTPLHEMNRSIQNTINYAANGQSFLYREVSIENEILLGLNFSSTVEGNTFFKVFAK